MEFTVAREPHGNNAGQNTKHQFQHGRYGKVNQRVTVAAFTVIPVSAEKPAAICAMTREIKITKVFTTPESASW